MTPVNALWGPGNIPESTGNATATAFGGHVLNDLDNALAWVLRVPKSGTITHVGFGVKTITGSPPDYYVGLVTLDVAGLPTAVPYGGSAVATYTPTTPGWVWLELSTPAAAVAGDLVAIHIYPTAIAPDAANCMWRIRWL